MEKGISGAAFGFASLVVFVIVIFSMYTNPYTPEGHEDYVFEQPRVWGNGGFQGAVRGPGNYGFAVWRNRAINVGFRPHTINENFKILARDDLNVTFRFQGVFKVNEGTIQEVVEKYGGKVWYQRFVKEPFRSFVRDSVQVYDSREMKSKPNGKSSPLRFKPS